MIYKVKNIAKEYTKASNISSLLFERYLSGLISRERLVEEVRKLNINCVNNVNELTLALEREEERL
jgi:hypothetical protein